MEAPILKMFVEKLPQIKILQDSNNVKTLEKEIRAM